MNAWRRGVRNAFRNVARSFGMVVSTAVTIARALCAQPRLILADEPTGGLGRASGQKIVESLRNAAPTQRTTVHVVTHDDKVAQQADRRLEIEDGVLTEIA